MLLRFLILSLLFCLGTTIQSQCFPRTFLNTTFKKCVFDLDGSGFQLFYTVHEKDGQCLWISDAQARCTGISTDEAFLSGTVTSLDSSDANKPRFSDTEKHIHLSGVDEAAIITNLNGGVVAGTATAGSSGTTLIDLSANFVNDGVTTGAKITTTPVIMGTATTIAPVSRDPSSMIFEKMGSGDPYPELWLRTSSRKYLRSDQSCPIRSG